MKKKPVKENWKLVGHIGVDSGMCWIGDPCYIGDGLPELDVSNEKGPYMKSFNYEAGHEGLGVCVSTGYGDGFYPVHALLEKDVSGRNRIAMIVIDFHLNAE